MASDTQNTIEQPYLTPGSRDLRLDLLKGYFIIRMLVDHAAGYSLIHWIMGGTGFLVSGAEGFLFLSGLLAGIVYYRVIHKNGLGEGVKKAASRCVNLYLIALTTSLIFLFISEHLQLRWARDLSMSQPLQIVIEAMTHKLHYPYTEILQVYALFFLFLPLILVFLEKQKKWIILTTSVVFYVAYLISPSAGNFPVLAESNNFINFSAAQLLMISGLLVGYQPYEQNKVLTRPIPRGWLILAVVGVILTIFSFYLIKNPSVAASFGITAENLRWLSTKAFSKVNLGPARLVAFYCFFTVMLHLVTRYWHWIHRITGWLLLPLGRYSLYAYLVHLPLILLIAILIKAMDLPKNNQWINLVLSSATVAISWWFTRKQWLVSNSHIKRYWYFVPIVVIMLFVGIETMYRLPGVYDGMRETFLMIRRFLRIE